MTGLTEDEKESISSELRRDGMTRQRADSWVSSFADWYEGYINNQIRVEPRKYAEYWIDTILFPAGYGTTVFGRQGMGKTNLGVFAMESGLILHKKWVFLHNIPFPSLVKRLMNNRFIEIRSAREMMAKIIDIIREGMIPVLCLDEFDSVFNSLNVNSKAGKSWQAFTWRQRHFSVRGPLMLYHAVKSIPPAVRNKQIGGEILWIKPWEEERYLSNPDLPYYMRIKRANIPFLTHGSVGFEIDMDFSWLLNRVSGSQEEVLDQIEDIMKELEEEKEIKKEERQGIELTCDSCGFSWIYKGKKAIARCPNCDHRIDLRSTTGGGGA